MVHCYSAIKLLYVLYSHIVCSICCTDSHEVVVKVITGITLLLAADTEHWRHIEGQIQNLFSIDSNKNMVLQNIQPSEHTSLILQTWENSECELIILFSIHLVHADFRSVVENYCFSWIFCCCTILPTAWEKIQNTLLTPQEALHFNSAQTKQTVVKTWPQTHKTEVKDEKRKAGKEGICKIMLCFVPSFHFLKCTFTTVL